MGHTDSMLIVHTSDWHVGRTLHGADLSPARDLFFEWLIDLVKSRHVDALLISGDLFDRAIPPAHVLRPLSDALVRLCSLTRVIIIPGNHDSAIRLGYLAPFLQDSLTIASTIEDIDRPIVVTSSDGEHATIYAIPYLEPDLVREPLSDIIDEDGQAIPLVRSHEAVISAALRRIGADIEARHGGHGMRSGEATGGHDGGRDNDESSGALNSDDGVRIVMSHAFFTGGAPSESERDIQVGGVASVPAGVFDEYGIDYVAAGHLHRPQNISGSSATIRYSGSPMPFSFSEASSTQSVTLLHIDGGTLTDIEAVLTPIWRNLDVIEGPFEQVISDQYAEQRDDFVSITVTDDIRPRDLIARIRHVFPYALAILHAPPVPASQRLTGPSRQAARSDRAVIDEYFEQTIGRSLNEAERSVIDSVWEQIQVRSVQ